MTTKTKTKARVLTVKEIRSWGPCYDPVDHKLCGPRWRGTIFDILDHESISQEDKIWCGIQYLDEKQQRLFAVWCAREALKLVDNPDPRSVNACDVAERFAHGNATQDELTAARTAAETAAETAAWYAAKAAWTAAETAAEDAAWYAAWYAAKAAWTAEAAAETAQIERIKEVIRLIEHL